MSSTPGGVFVRRAEFDDAQSIQALVGEEAPLMAKRFGAFDITNMIENASLGISAVDEKGAVVGYAAFYDYPALTPEADPAAWPDWLHRSFGHPEYTAANTAWLAFFVADHLSENEVAESMLRTAFTTLPDIDCILFALPGDAHPFAPLKDTFDPLRRLSSGADEVAVFACPRRLYLPDLLVRDARVEDHDDLVPVFNAQSEVLTERYGEFFIAELIEAQDEANRALVAEVDGHAVGLMSTSSDIDVGILRDCFDLEPYDGLMKQDQEALRILRAARAAAAEEEAAKEAQLQAEADAEAARKAEEEGEAGEADAPAAEAEAPAGAPAGEEDAGEEGEAELTEEEIAARKAEAAAAREAAKKAAAEARARAKAEREAAEEAAVPLITNAFCITVFAMDESFESRSKDLLSKAFALYPDKEYAVITLPHTTPEFPLLNYFTQAEPKPSSSFGHLVYLYHRDALLPSLTVRAATVLDASAVSALTSTLVLSAEIAADFAAATGPVAEGEERPMAAFVAECAGALVGVVLVKSTIDASELQGLYALEDFILFTEHKPSQHFELKTFVVNPIFGRSSRFMLKEVFRLLKKSCLYLRLYPSTPLPEVLGEFVQVRPRRQITVSPSLAAEVADLRGEAEYTRPTADGALFFLTRKLISEPKIVNNSRIVVVGASDAALAFLETLLTVPYLTFTNLFLLAPRAAERLRLPRGAAEDEAADEATGGGGGAAAADGGAPTAFLSRTYGYSAAELRQLAIGARVRLVESRMVGIERARKAVVLPDDSILPYDYLVVAPELGDQSLVPLGAEAAAVRGAFSLSDEEAVASAVAFLETSGALGGGTIAVYGASLDAYCTVQALLARGVKPSQIVAVQPPPSANAPDAFGDPRVAEKVAAKMAQLGVRVDKNVRLAGLESDEQQNLSACLLELPRAAPNAPANVSALPCQALLCCGTREIDRSTFRALNSNSIVYDGGLVIDHNFRTNDPAIYAGGPVTKFSRRCRYKLRLELCSGREVGVKLAQALLPTLDPLSGETPPPDAGPEPSFTQPRMEGAVLPGGLHYLNVVTPKAGSDRYETIVADAAFGRELVWDGGSPDSFCAVRLDKRGAVHSMVYLGKESVEVLNWAQLVGLPETAINRLASRFDEKIVPDLPAFLRQTWATALYHDRFGEFRAALRLEMAEDDDFKKVMEAVRASEQLKQGKPLQVADFIEMLPERKRALVHARLLDYTQTNQNHLDMYLVPSAPIMKKMEDTKLR